MAGVLISGRRKKKEDGTTEITKKEKDSVRIDHDALRQLLIKPEIGDKPIAIISVTGSMRTGKSYLLNFFVRYFRERGWENLDWIEKDSESTSSVTFHWKGGTERCTTGIQLLSEPFEVPMQNGGTMFVFLMDTQGLFDNRTSKEGDKALLTLSTMASSIQIFNTMRNIDSQKLQYLKTCVDFALATAQRAGGYLKLQRLMFLVRDFPDDENSDPASCYTLRAGGEYLNGILGSEEGGEEQIEVRRGIKKSFEDARCFPMPHPGIPATKARFSGRNHEIDPDFLGCMKTFVEETASPALLVPKCSKESFMNARQLLNMLIECDAIFSEELFKASDIMKANEKAYYAAACEEASAEYLKVLKNRVEINPDATENELKTIYKEVKKHAMKRFKSTFPMGSGNFEATYREHLDEQCEKQFDQVKNQFLKEQKARGMKLEKATQKALSDYEKEMQDYLLWTPEELEKRHGSCLAGIEKKNSKNVNFNKLKAGINEHYQNMKKKNEEYHDKMGTTTQEKRKLELHNLVAEKLKRTITEKWDKILGNHPSDAEMKDAYETMMEEICESYWKLALTEMEYKYQRILETEMSRTENIMRSGEEMCTTSARDAASMKPPEDEMLLHDRVSEIVKSFAGCWTKEKDQWTDQEWEKELDVIRKNHKRMFIDACSEYIMKYFELLRDEIFKEEYEKAKRRNAENRELFAKEMRNTVDLAILRLESHLEEVMVDRHFDETELSNFYETATKDLIKKHPDELVEILSRSKSAKKEFKKTVKQNMQESREKMVARNREIKDKRIVTGCDVPEVPGFFERIWNWVKSKLGL